VYGLAMSEPVTCPNCLEMTETLSDSGICAECVEWFDSQDALYREDLRQMAEYEDSDFEDSESDCEDLDYEEEDP